MFKFVASRSGVSIQELKSRGRLEHINKARQIAFWLCRRAGYTYHATGRFCGRDHATVIHGVVNVNNLMDCYPKYAADVMRLTREFERNKVVKSVNDSAIQH